MAGAESMRLELSWPNKDKFLLSPKDETGKPVWVDRSHPAASEVRLVEWVGNCGTVNDADPVSDNLLFTGDSLDVLRVLADHPEFRREYRGRVRCVYIDPPFNTGQAFEHYDDWMEHSTWLSFMRDRLLLIKELLRVDGTVWVHLDNAEVHRMRCLMDEIMGAGSFLAQVVWKRTQGKSSAKRGMGTMCDTILVYGKSDQVTLKPVLLPLTDKHLAEKYRFTDERGRYSQGDLRAPGLRKGDSGEPWRGRNPGGRDRHWAAPTVAGVTDGENADLPTRQRLDLLDAAGYIHWPPGDASVPMLKRYLREDSGIAVGDLWDDIPRVANTSKERRGYDTQKPEHLLQRVLRMATDPGDIVVDVFAGSGTTAATAAKMGRRWVSADLSPNSIEKFVAPRLTDVVLGQDEAGVSAEIGWKGGGGFRTATVAPSMYEVSENGIVLLGERATNGTFARAMAAQLDFDSQPYGAPFCGIRGRMRLAVLDGAVGPDEVRSIVSALGEQERVTVVGQVVLPGAEEMLASLSKGSRIRKAPRDVLADGARRTKRRETAR